MQLFLDHYRQVRDCFSKDGCKQQAQKLKEIFVAHPRTTGETYGEHLWFTSKMGVRILYTSAVLIIHGLFPFLLTRAASRQIEIIYSIMKTRIPKSRRDEIDLDYSV